MTSEKKGERKAAGEGRLDYFVMEEIVFFFAGLAHASDCATYQNRDADRNQNCRQIAAQVRQVEQNFVHFRDPHKQLHRTKKSKIGRWFPP
jgi:hypothetical protein